MNPQKETSHCHVSAPGAGMGPAPWALEMKLTEGCHKWADPRLPGGAADVNESVCSPQFTLE